MVIDRICESLVVCPMSTVEYRRFLVDDDDDRSFIRHAEQSGVPALNTSISLLREQNYEANLQLFQEA